MRVYKAYFLILRQYKATVLIFFAVFMSLSLVMTKINSSDGGQQEEVFTQEKLDIAIVDEDEGMAAKLLQEYFGKNNQVQTMDYDEAAITDSLYWRELDYVLVIPKGFSDALAKGEFMELSAMKVPGDFDAVYFESELTMYLQKIRALTCAGSTLPEASATLKALQNEETEVKIASFINEKQNDINSIFFLYVPYLFITVGVSGIALVLLRMNAREVRERTECSSMPMAQRIVQIVAAVLTYGMVLYGIVWLEDIILSGGAILHDHRLPWFLLNIFAMLLFGMSLGFATGMIARNDDAVNGIVNVTSLTLCFFGGVFVPKTFFSDGVRAVAQLFPTYWYVSNNELISQMTHADDAFRQTMLAQTGVILAYTLVIFAATLVFVSAKRKRTA